MLRGVLFVWVLAFPFGAGASVIVALPEAELIRHADTILVGRVIKTHTFIHRGGQVATRAYIEVRKGLRGVENHQVITIEVPGGRLANGLEAHAPGSPRLKGGDVLFAFLESRGKIKRPLGLSYGLLRVRRAADGSERVFRETDGLSMLSRLGEPVDPGSVTLRDLPLDVLLTRVESTLRILDLPADGTVTP